MNTCITCIHYFENEDKCTRRNKIDPVTGKLHDPATTFFPRAGEERTGWAILGTCGKKGKYWKKA